MTFTVEQIEEEGRKLSRSNGRALQAAMMFEHAAMKRREAESVPFGYCDPSKIESVSNEKHGAGIGIYTTRLPNEEKTQPLYTSPPSPPSTGVPDGFKLPEREHETTDTVEGEVTTDGIYGVGWRDGWNACLDAVEKSISVATRSP